MRAAADAFFTLSVELSFATRAAAAGPLHDGCSRWPAACRIDRQIEEKAPSGAFFVAARECAAPVHRNIRTFSRTMFVASSASAVGICVLITPFLSGSSSSAAGTMLKFAAIGVISVPQ